MALGVFSVTGEALNFGGRRMETIMRVSWLPVALLLIVNMATVFAYLSVIAGKLVTFADVPTFERAQRLLSVYSGQGWAQRPGAMTAVTVGNLVLQALLIASFMAPLIRFAGLGERPRPGVIKLAFGPDQIRYIVSGAFSFLFVAILILTPIATTTFFVLQYIFDALSQTVARFPDPNSLHTIELTTSAETIAAQGMSWIYYMALPTAAAIPFILALWLLTYLHFHPSNRPSASGRANPLMRAAATLFVTAAFLAGAYWVLRQNLLQNVNAIASLSGAGSGGDLAGGAVSAFLILGIVAYLLFGYFNLRLYPYPGVAVCRKSLALGNTLRLSRGWNIIRLQVILILVSGFLLIAQYLINTYALNWILQTISVLYQAAGASTRLLNSGVTAEWVQPLFVWIWNGVKILINILWAFFSYGVAAGLYGRLYRESERTLDSA